MTVNLLAVQPNPGGRDITRVLQILLASTDVYVAGGIPVDLTAAVNVPKAGRGKVPNYVVSPNLPPLAWRFSVAGFPAGYTGELIRNTVSPTLANFLLKIFDIAAAAELAAAGIPANIYNDVNGFVFNLATPKKAG